MKNDASERKTLLEAIMRRFSAVFQKKKYDAQTNDFLCWSFDNEFLS